MGRRVGNRQMEREKLCTLERRPTIVRREEASIVRQEVWMKMIEEWYRSPFTYYRSACSPAQFDSSNSCASSKIERGSELKVIAECLSYAVGWTETSRLVTRQPQLQQGNHNCDKVTTTACQWFGQIRLIIKTRLASRGEKKEKKTKFACRGNQETKDV